MAAALVALLATGCDVQPGAVEYLTQAPGARPAEVMTAAGPVRGVAAPEGQAFLGIPFAAAPTGPLRWRPPQPPAPWPAPRDATRLGNGCMQNFGLDYVLGSRSAWWIKGDEDCLNLNVYAPAGASPGARLPVMVWLYGGTFVLGSNRQYDPSRLAQAQGVIVVVPNYRLGTLGFLSHPALRAEADGAANLGLLDQQAALRWVRDNIAGFGGDPANVTLFGESAGSWSACFLLAAPGAAGLFQRVILQSGVCILPASATPVAEADAAGRELAAALGCADLKTAAACLRSLSAHELTATPARTSSPVGPRGWSPVTGDTVLPLSPREAFSTGRFNRVPVLNGTNRDEGRLFSLLLRLIGELYTEESYRAQVARLMGSRTAAVLRAYGADMAAPQRFAAIATDGAFACPALQLNRLLAEHVPVHAYEFADEQAASRIPSLPFLPPLGAYHAGEVAYVFGTPWILADPAEFTPAQRQLSHAMQDAWGSFARGGPPGAASLPDWRRFGAAAEQVLALRPEGSRMRDDLAAAHRCRFWDSLAY
ncbi:carboxylesterase family protein [Roseomonas sp. M0104]|uniref:Carboxylic ester hydrolase n=1 Tax=Teichococcus coralli TaxID=2545983 RepID=A0A845B6M5_9PROT|nr:carboxylesterase family protein [Pseudoroseomonas coralli]MXP61756.1 carboxylesterase family protein [Pseudoroseomonas coralli]